MLLASVDVLWLNIHIQSRIQQPTEAGDTSSHRTSEFSMHDDEMDDTSLASFFVLRPYLLHSARFYDKDRTVPT